MGVRPSPLASVTPLVPVPRPADAGLTAPAGRAVPPGRDRRRQAQAARLVATVTEVDVGASTIVISDVWDKRRRHAQLEVVATSATTITVGGRPATLAEISEHDQVVVSGVLTGMLVLAWEIDTMGPLSMTG